MSLSRHVDADDLLAKAENDPHTMLMAKATLGKHSPLHHSGAHAGRYRTEPIPKYKLPAKGVPGEAAYQVITDELALDGKPTLNLASFVHTWMPEQATKLIMENISINLSDQDEYPATMAIHGRCVSMIADLWHAPKTRGEDGKFVGAEGVATTGSSEAIMLGGLAMKKRWQNKRKAEGKSWKEPGPNIVFGSNAQVAIEKFARYFDIEERLVPVSKESHYRMDPKKAIEMVDENTIGVIVILGSTYTGHYEPVEEMCQLLDDYEKRTGIHIPVHVDGASGGFVAPFAHPHLKWDFRQPRVVSINTSGHKFGLVYPGLGWIIFRSPEVLPKELVFELHYLGSTEYSFGLNFSRPAAPVLGQYFNLISLGFEGYKNIAYEDMKNARVLSRALEASGYYEVLSDIHRPVNSAAHATAVVGAKVGVTDPSDPEYYQAGLPVVSFRWSESFRKQNPRLEQRWMQTLLRAKGWIVPNYSLSPDCGNIEVLRVVVRENCSLDLLDQLVHDIISITESLADESSASAHLANVLSKQPAQVAAADPNKKSTTKRVTRDLHIPEHNRGVKAKGYSKQC